MHDFIVETVSGKVRGHAANGSVAFLGIPYGAPTVGAMLFLPSKEPAAWAGVRDAASYGPSAPQTDMGMISEASQRALGPLTSPDASEDCLVLNVWAPALDDARRPVMV